MCVRVRQQDCNRSTTPISLTRPRAPSFPPQSQPAQTIHAVSPTVASLPLHDSDPDPLAIKLNTAPNLHRATRQSPPASTSRANAGPLSVQVHSHVAALATTTAAIGLQIANRHQATPSTASHLASIHSQQSLRRQHPHHPLTGH